MLDVKNWALVAVSARSLNNLKSWPLVLVSCVLLKILLQSESYSPCIYLYVCIISPRFLLYTNDGSFSFRRRSSYGRSLRDGIILVALRCTASTSFISLFRLGLQISTPYSSRDLTSGLYNCNIVFSSMNEYLGWWLVWDDMLVRILLYRKKPLHFKILSFLRRSKER